MEDLIKYQGGCHCGAILFEVWAPKGGLISESFSLWRKSPISEE
jgi:hypothetical protein